MIGKRYFCFEPSQLVSGALLVPRKISQDCLLSVVCTYLSFLCPTLTAEFITSFFLFCRVTCAFLVFVFAFYRQWGEYNCKLPCRKMNVIKQLFALFKQHNNGHGKCQF